VACNDQQPRDNELQPPANRALLETLLISI